MDPKDRIIVALDFPTLEEAEKMAIRLKGNVGGYKVGLELIHSDFGGPAAVKSIQSSVGRSTVFYDCKLHDIPNTVTGAVRRIVPLEVKMFNVHCLGGYWMMKAAADTTKEESIRFSLFPNGPRVLGITILTSLDYYAFMDMGLAPKIETGQYTLAREMEKVQSDWMRSKVIELAKSANRAGLDGVIASPQEIADIKQACPSLIIVTPSIRASDSPADDQKRTATVAEAIKAGADYLVIGRPITKAPDPVEAAKKIAEEIASV